MNENLLALFPESTITPFFLCRPPLDPSGGDVVTDNFEIDSNSRIKHKCPIISWMVMVSWTRGPIAYTPRLQRSSVESINVSIACRVHSFISHAAQIADQA